MISELAAWSGRCDSVLAELEAEIKKVKADAERRSKREAKAEKQIKAVMEVNEKGSTGFMGIGASRSGHNTRGAKRDNDDEDDDMMDLDDNITVGKKKGGSNILQRFTRGSSGKS